jgi:hypothetical protein
MFGLGTLDVVIGLIFVYLLLSLICTAASEVVEGWLKTRAKTLEQGIRELLRDGDNTGLVEKFYKHPLIFGLYDGTYEAAKKGTGSRKIFGGSDLPSYIPSRNFALALMDVILPGDAVKPSGAAGATVPSGAVGTTVPSDPNVISPPADAVGATVPSNSNVAPPPADAAPAKPLQALRDSISVLPNKQVKQALLPLVDAAGDDVSRARKNIEDWYDSSMDRVSGWYKRQTQARILFFAALVTVAMNANTITIVDRLVSDPAIREVIVAQAQKVVDKNEIPAGSLDESITKVKKLGLPIGWSNMEYKLDELGWAPSSWWRLILFHLLGWLITAFALSLGAPFWFDLLNKIMVIRATVKPKEKSPPEPPVDRR